MTSCRAVSIEGYLVPGSFRNLLLDFAIESLLRRFQDYGLEFTKECTVPRYEARTVTRPAPSIFRRLTVHPECYRTPVRSPKASVPRLEGVAIWFDYHTVLSRQWPILGDLQTESFEMNSVMRSVVGRSSLETESRYRILKNMQDTADKALN
ncbi:hypothetical protein K440DRAFT_110759 [Wilcoxina mikolae CBS 423.85]|nr:hypothetical protein K440DRAFT_110759 [Wilcoxina mikolae CBS 423.85]